MADVTDVLRDRMSEPGGFERMATLSVFAHGALIALVLFAPGRWFEQSVAAPQTVMTITLNGGAPGPQSGGLTSLAARPVQAVTPPDEAPRREAVRPPAAKTPEMTLPTPKARPTRAAPATPVQEAPPEARGRTPTRGAQTSPGTAIAETTARGQGFGLSTGGGPGSGSTLDVSNFCCPDYIALMTERIRANWRPQAEVAGEAVVKFTIVRDGRLTEVALERSSGYSALDLTAQRAVYTTRQLPPLPGAFPDPTLTVHLNFQYTR